MSYCSMKPQAVGSISPAIRPNESRLTPILKIQVVSKEQQKLRAEETLIAVSRRDMGLSLAIASLIGVNLLSPEPVEALVTKAERKRKIKEKLKNLREKAESTKPDKGQDESPSPPLAKEEEPSLPALPTLLKSPAGPPVDAFLLQ